MISNTLCMHVISSEFCASVFCEVWFYDENGASKHVSTHCKILSILKE